MGVKVKASLGTEKYYTEVIAGENTLITDEPVDKGGGDRKGWEIPIINVEVDLENYPQTKTAQFCRVIDFGNTEISEDIKDRLFKIADACPIHKTLTNDIEILTKIN